MGRAFGVAADGEACNRFETPRGRFRMPDVTAANADIAQDIATPELMKSISAAFNSRDVDRIAACFTDDATFGWRGPGRSGDVSKEAIRKTLAIAS
jgi:hypothetical protein